MRKVLFIFVLFSVGCSSAFVDDLFPTFTPVVEMVVTETATFEPTYTETPTLISPTISVSTQSIATVEENDTWKYVVLAYFKLRCVARDLNGTPINCRIRKDPNLSSQYRAVHYGTEVEATALSHCEVYLSCDASIVEWYQLTTGEWAAALDYVWQDITPEKE